MVSRSKAYSTCCIIIAAKAQAIAHTPAMSKSSNMTHPYSACYRMVRVSGPPNRARHGPVATPEMLAGAAMRGNEPRYSGLASVSHYCRFRMRSWQTCQFRGVIVN